MAPRITEQGIARLSQDCLRRLLEKSDAAQAAYIRQLGLSDAAVDRIAEEAVAQVRAERNGR